MTNIFVVNKVIKVVNEIHVKKMVNNIHFCVFQK